MGEAQAESVDYPLWSLLPAGLPVLLAPFRAVAHWLILLVGVSVHCVVVGGWGKPFTT